MKRTTWWSVAAVAVLASVTCVAVAATGIAGAGSAPVTIETRKPTAPAIAGDRVVWSDYVDDSYDIFLYDGASGVTSRLTSTPENEVQPATDGKTVVWVQYGAKDADIIAYDIASRSYVTVTNASGNQLNPDVNGDFVVWEERGRSYVPQVYARSLSSGDPFKIDGLSQSAARRPRMGGNWVVYEYLPMNLSDDGDIRAYNLVTKAITTIANTDAQELLPVTDGRYVIWADGSGADRDIQGYDLQAGSAFPVRVQDGNQTYPVIDDGIAYWVHNQPGKRLHLDGYNIADARSFAFNDAGSSDVNAVSARGGGIAWLEPRRDGQWRLRAILGPSRSATSSLASLLPVSPAWLPFRLAQLSTAGDTTAPTIVSTSVEPGATNVDANTDVTAYFSEALDASTVDAGSVQLVAASTGEPVEASVRYSALAKAVTVSPDEPLAEDSFTLSVAAGISDRVGNAIGVPLAVSFATDSIMADTLAPTKPGNPAARVSGLSQVSVTWTASMDDVGVTGYDIYRDTVSFITIGSRTPIASVGAGATSALVNIDSTVPTERTKKYTLYYVVVAKDAAGNTALSGNAVPDPHGTTAIGTNTCLGCHSVHSGGGKPSSWGALGAKGAEACYLCHGNTAMATAFGYGSSLNTQARFFDYAASPLPDGGTRHRNTYMAVTSGNQNSCDMCHTSHRKPYDADSTKGYTRMLRYWDSGSGGRFLYYRSDGNVVDVSGVVVKAGLGNEYCTSCHGASLERIENIDVGGPGAWASSSGDHATGFDAGAHGSATVRWDPARATADGPKISCEACHNKHASPIGGLVDYRMTNTQTNTYEQSGVCFACHVDNYIAEQASGMSVSSNAFSAWNGRNVRTEFARASRHPYAAQTGAPQSQAGQWIQTSEEDFGNDLLVNTSVQAGGTGTSGLIQLTATAGSSSTLFTDGFETNFTNWGTYTNWTRSTTTVHSGTYTALQSGTGAITSTLISNNFSTSGKTNVQVSFWRRGTNATEDADTFAVAFRDNSGTWRTIQTWTLGQTSAPALAWTQYTVSIPSGYYGANSAIRFISVTSDNANEAQRVDDVLVSSDAVASGYVNSGSAVSTPIAVVGGTLDSWTNLVMSGTQPAGSTQRFDILKGTASGTEALGHANVLVSDLTLAQSPYPLVIDKVANPTIKIRTRMTGNGTAPASVADAFDGSSFDTAKWTNFRLGGALDPDAARTETIWNGDMENWPSLTEPNVGFTTNAGNWEYRLNQSDGQISGTTDYIRKRQTAGTFDIVKSGINLSGYATGSLNLYYVTSLFSTGDSLQVIWSNANGSWTLLNQTATQGTRSNGNWANLNVNLTGNQVDDGCTLTIRHVGSTTNNNNQEAYVDQILVTGTTAVTDSWPSQQGGTLSLSSEGPDFWGTADQGDFTYIKPSAGTWIATGDFNLQVQVPSYNNSAGDPWMKAGVMIRTGTSEANAQATGAKMAGMYVTDGNGVSFQYRTTAGGTAAGTGTQADPKDVAPTWLRLERRGNVITGLVSDDGASWRSIGSQTVTLDSTVLVGIALTSHVDNQFSDATFDNFSVSATAFTPSTVTPQLHDWAVNYMWTPSPTATGSLTCYNCHNTHMVQKGTAGAAWQTSRVSNPANTKQNYTGTGFSAFCLTCHKQASGTVLTAVTNSSTTLVPYNVVLRDMSAYSFFPGWNKTTASVDWSGGRHAGVGAVAGCETCHDPHGSNFQRLTALTVGATARANTNASVSKEQNLCASASGCHSSAGTGSKNTGTAFSQTYRHPIATDDRHSDLEGQSDFGSENRHSECVDCHDPHAARAGIHSSGSAAGGGAIRGSFGVKPSWSGEWTVATGYTIVRNTGQTTDYEAYLCFKCHSSYSGQPYSVTSNGRTYTSTDVALEFNENNESGHNVIGKSTDGSSIWPKTSGIGAANNRTWSLPTTANWLKTGWTPTSKVTCSDCHTWGGTGASGPHGSSVKYMLDSRYPTDYETAYLDMGSTSLNALICTKCHNANYRGMNNVHADGDHSGTVDARCIGCHVKIPHGWKRPRLLGYRGDPEPYRSLYLTGITDKSYTPNGWNKSDCGQSGCGEHSASQSGTRWP